MPYSYKEEKPWLFTDEGQRVLLRVLDRAREMIEKAGAVRETELMAKTTGDSFKALAVVDRLVELGYLARVTDHDVPRQNTVYVASLNMKG